MAATLDTLEIVKRLRDAGFNETQAEAVTTIFRDVREADFARLTTKADLDRTETALRSEIEKVQLSTKSDLRDTEQRLTIRFGSMIVVATGLLLAAKFFG
jgi:hypothetical protein